MTLPTIHANGTSKERLLLALTGASDALEFAFEKLKRTAPNGRDYYPQGAGYLDTAQDEHEARLRKLDEVKNEIDALTIAIDAIS